MSIVSFSIDEHRFRPTAAALWRRKANYPGLHSQRSNKRLKKLNLSKSFSFNSFGYIFRFIYFHSIGEQYKLCTLTVLIKMKPLFVSLK